MSLQKGTDKPYSFNERFQRKILSLCVQDLGFLESIALEVIKPEYFDDKILRHMCVWTFEFYHKYKNVPSYEFLYNQVLKGVSDGFLENRDLEPCNELINSLTEVIIEDKDYIQDQVISFGREHALKKTIFECVGLINTGSNLDCIPKMFEDALSIGSGVDIGKRYPDLDELPEVLYKDTRDDVLVKTGLDTLDDALTGGMNKGELHLLVGRPGVGKSKVLTNFGVSALAYGHSVVYITAELKENDVLANFASRITGFSYTDIMNPMNESDYRDRINKLKSKKVNESGEVENKLFVKYFRQGSPIQIIKSYLSKLNLRSNFNPGLIIIDYMDLFRPSEYKQSLYEDGGNIAYELVDIADSFKCPVLTASQPQRHAWFIPIIEEEHLADSSRKAHVAFSVISLNQTRKEEQEGQMRLFTAKVRKGKTGKTVFCHFDKARCLLSETSERWSPT